VKQTLQPNDHVHARAVAPSRRELVWEAWRSLDRNECSPVTKIAAQLDLTTAQVAEIVYPAESYGEWADEQEPMEFPDPVDPWFGNWRSAQGMTLCGPGDVTVWIDWSDPAAALTVLLDKLTDPNVVSATYVRCDGRPYIAFTTAAEASAHQEWMVANAEGLTHVDIGA
jgi:hypothetical protein